MSDLLITIIVSILGWVVVHYLSVQRDRDKEHREFSRKVIDFLEQVEKDALIYHTSETRNFDLEKEIKFNLDLLDHRLGVVASYYKEFSPSFFYFRSSITLENFQCNNFIQQPSNSALVLEIRKQAQEIKTSIYKFL